MIIYKVIERKNPSEPSTPAKFYGIPVCYNQLDIDDLAERISANCTVTRADCLAVLASLQEQIILALQEGSKVHLGDLGSFRLTFRGSGADTAEDYKPSLIKKVNVCFTANVELKEAMQVSNKAIRFISLESYKNSKNETDGTEEVQP